MNIKTENDVSLRPIDEADLPFLQRVYASTRLDELAPLQWSAGQKDAFLSMQFTAQHEHYQRHFAGADFQVILLEGEPVGRLYIQRTSEELRIIDIALLPEARRKGLGTALLKEILAEAALTNRPVRICVERFNPALCLYERLGFLKTGDTAVYYQMEWIPQGVESNK